MISLRFLFLYGVYSFICHVKCCVCAGTVNHAFKHLKTLPKIYEDRTNKIFNLSHNQIEALLHKSFYYKGYGSAEILDLSFNNIGDIYLHAFIGLTEIMALDLSYNKIIKVSKKAFAPLRKLAELNLSNNPLIQVSDRSWSVPPISNLFIRNCDVQRFEDVFRPQSEEDTSWLTSIKRLSLENNSISYISARQAEIIRRIDKADLAGNPLECSQAAYNILAEKSIDCKITDHYAEEPQLSVKHHVWKSVWVNDQPFNHEGEVTFYETLDVYHGKCDSDTRIVGRTSTVSILNLEARFTNATLSNGEISSLVGPRLYEVLDTQYHCISERKRIVSQINGKVMIKCIECVGSKCDPEVHPYGKIVLFESYFVLQFLAICIFMIMRALKAYSEVEIKLFR